MSAKFGEIGHMRPIWGLCGHPRTRVGHRPNLSIAVPRLIGIVTRRSGSDHFSIRLLPKSAGLSAESDRAWAEFGQAQPILTRVWGDFDLI